MLKDLPVHTRQSLYRCLDVTSEPWIEGESEITWAKYTGISIELMSYGVRIEVNNRNCSIYDQPCLITDTAFEWFRYDRRLNRVRHREKGPAVVLEPAELWTESTQADRERMWLCGTFEIGFLPGGSYYYFDGKLHRIGEPAVETTDGFKAYFEHGQLIRRTLS